MALEAVVFKQVPFNECKDFHALLGVGHLSNEGTQKEQTVNVKNLNEYDPSSSFVLESVKELDTVDSSSENYCANGLLDSVIFPQMEANIGRQKRRRTSIAKNNEEVENQRMIHIVVERNRRKQMNDYLKLLRSMMPSSFVQRGDQASIVEGAINYLKELEQVVQFQEANKGKNKKLSKSNKYCTIFSELFSFPQYSTCSEQHNSNNSSTSSENRTLKGEKRSAIADVEVTMMESYANIKLLLKRNQKQLLKLVVGLHFLNLLILHLNVTTVESMVLYCFSVKVEDECNYFSVNDIAASVYEMVGRIQEQEEAGF